MSEKCVICGNRHLYGRCPNLDNEDCFICTIADDQCKTSNFKVDCGIYRMAQQNAELQKSHDMIDKSNLDLCYKIADKDEEIKQLQKSLAESKKQIVNAIQHFKGLLYLIKDPKEDELLDAFNHDIDEGIKILGEASSKEGSEVDKA